MFQHAGEVRTLQRKDTQFGKKFLLADAQAERAARQVVRLNFTWGGLNDGLAIAG
jgi:hypothetical protein